MSTDLRQQTARMRSVVERAKELHRQLADENATLRRQLEEADSRTARLQVSLDDMTARYESLQAAIAAGATEPLAIDRTLEKYEAMIAAIDDCIARMETRK